MIANLAVDHAKGDISGLVSFYGERKIQELDPATVIDRATITLIDRITGGPVAAGLTDNQGRFTISNFGNFIPDATREYVLKATKSVAGPNSPTVSLSTLLKYVAGPPAGFTSITNSTVGGQIHINQLTTAIALQVGLDNTTFGLAIGSVDPTNSPPALVKDLGSKSPPDQTLSLAGTVKSYILNSVDPHTIKASVAKINASGGLDPTEGIPGVTMVTINGLGFATYPGGNTVTVGGRNATILYVTLDGTKMVIQLPQSARNGGIVVSVRGATVSSNTVPFFIPPGTNVAVTSIAAEPPNPGLGFDQYITINGMGFLPPPDSGLNKVIVPKYGGSTLTITGTNCNGTAFSSGNPAGQPGCIDPIKSTSKLLRVRLASEVDAGSVTVQNDNGDSVPLFAELGNHYISVTEIWPNVGASWQDVEISGLLFGAAKGTVVVGGSNVHTDSIQWWSDKKIRLKVPAGLPGGNTSIRITTASGASITVPWTLLDGNTNNQGWQLKLNIGNGQGQYPIPVFWSNKYMYFAGGGNSNLSRVKLAADGAVAGGIENVGSMAIGVLQQDMHGDFNGFVGKRFYVMEDRGGRGLAHIQFNTEGEFVSMGAREDNPVGLSETAFSAGRRGAYNYNGYSCTDLYWKTYNPANDTYSNGWTGTRGKPMGCQAEAPMLVMGNNLWFFAMAGQWRSIIGADGTPGDFSNPSSNGLNHGAYGANVGLVGKYMYMTGEWCGGPFVRRTGIANDGPETMGGWPAYGNANYDFGGGGTVLAVGKYYYKIGGWCANTSGVAGTTLN